MIHKMTTKLFWDVCSSLLRDRETITRRHFFRREYLTLKCYTCSTGATRIGSPSHRLGCHLSCRFGYTLGRGFGTRFGSFGGRLGSKLRSIAHEVQLFIGKDNLPTPMVHVHSLPKQSQCPMWCHCLLPNHLASTTMSASDWKLTIVQAGYGSRRLTFMAKIVKKQKKILHDRV